MLRSRTLRALLVLSLPLALLAACGDDDDPEETTAGATSEGGGGTEGGGELTPVRLQLQWVAQAQFGGYYAALAEGFYEDEGLDVEILEGGVDIVPQQVLASGGAEFGIAWVPKALASIEEGAEITNVAQVFQRSGTLQVALAESGIDSVEDLAGKNVGNWGFGNEFELLAGLESAGLDPESDVSLVQQQFDMNALLNGEVDAAMAMTYNEYAQVLEAENPETGELYQPDELDVIDWNDVGVAMLQDAIWAGNDYLAENEDVAVRFVKASLRGWAFCRDEFDACVEHVLEAGTQLPESHQRWQLNEVNKLIWPSPDEGVGFLTPDSYDQTIEVATTSGLLAAEPEGEVFTTDVAEQALAELEEEGLDTTGEDFEPTEVVLEPGGA